ncbi:hypothetical protein Tco_0270718, partial [Tanacetum coccineum]
MLRLCHRLIACNIVGRSQAPKKVTVTDLFYLRGMDVGSVNIPYLLARYLRLFASGRNQGAMISRGQFVSHLAENFGLLNKERLQGLTICEELDDTWAWVAPGPEWQPDATAGTPKATGMLLKLMRVLRLIQHLCRHLNHHMLLSGLCLRGLRGSRRRWTSYSKALWDYVEMSTNRSLIRVGLRQHSHRKLMVALSETHQAQDRRCQHLYNPAGRAATRPMIPLLLIFLFLSFVHLYYSYHDVPKLKTAYPLMYMLWYDDFDLFVHDRIKPGRPRCKEIDKVGEVSIIWNPVVETLVSNPSESDDFSLGECNLFDIDDSFYEKSTSRLDHLAPISPETVEVCVNNDDTDDNDDYDMPVCDESSPIFT